MNKKTTALLSILLGTGSVLMLVFLVFSMTKANPDCTVNDNLVVAGTVKITDGTEGVNKVLTSDANGLASWQLVASGGSPVDWDCEYIVGPASRFGLTTQALCSPGYVLISGGGSTMNCDEYKQGIVNGANREGWWVKDEEGGGNSVSPFALCCK